MTAALSTEPAVGAADEVLVLERAAMERWAKGDPDGFLEISDTDVTYFDPFVEKRLNGREELRALYETLRGQVKLDEFEFIEPRVQVAGDMAVLTYNFRSQGGDTVSEWNTTEVFRRRDGRWRIVHTHWAFRKAGAATQ